MRQAYQRGLALDVKLRTNESAPRRGARHLPEQRREGQGVSYLPRFFAAFLPSESQLVI